MPVMDNSLIAGGGAFATTPTSYTANVADSGQLGFGPVLPNLDGNTPQVYLPLQFVVTHVPGMFNYIPGASAFFKALFETHMVSMEGLDFQYAMENEGTPVGRDGQMMNVPTRHTRSQITPTATWGEKIGNPVFNMHHVWANGMHDVDTQAASLAGIVASGTTLPPHVASMYAADILAIQYDTTMRPENIIDAFWMTNVFPTDYGSPGYQYNAIETHRPDRTVTYHTVVQHNHNTVAVAKQVAGLLNLHAINYQDANPIARQIDSQLSGQGLQAQVANILSGFSNLDGNVG